MQRRRERLIANSITDIHCHILPGIDDGARSMETSVKMAEIALSEGITRIVATPHFDPEIKSIEDFASERDEAILNLKDELAQRNIKIDILQGAEVYLTPLLPDMDRLDLLCLRDSRYMLVEIPFTTLPQWLDEILYSIQLRGITPILAHPERYARMVENPHILAGLVDKGLLLQINASSMCHKSDRKVKSFIRYLIKSGMVHFLATDAHSVRSRPPRIQESISIILQAFGSDIAEYMLENARKIGDGGAVEKLPVVEYRQGVLERLFG